ncbi:GntR family transcriptional regulator [Tannockella kyphosi]|uniref:GntR family transcriptional regulator n=1 Tax=Tannockella kyphosi TaxID=2899121 RepID=UPI00201154B6|nr:GntR family transcriptional regulator [Tannockella kyphosi]
MVKYIDIADDIREKIIEQTYTYGQKLPYEYVLCVTYHCNKETMKKALDILVKEGLIVRRRGAGTFVKDYDPSNDDVLKKGDRYGVGLTGKYQGFYRIRSEVVEFSVIPSDLEISKKLQIEEGSFVYHVIRARYLEEIPYVLEIIYMPISVIANLRLENVSNSIYAYIEDELGLKIQSSHKTITGELSTPLEQQYLELSEKEPFFQVEKVSYLSSGVIFEYSLNRYHYNQFEENTVTVHY